MIVNVVVKLAGRLQLLPSGKSQSCSHAFLLYRRITHWESIYISMRKTNCSNQTLQMEKSDMGNSLFCHRNLWGWAGLKMIQQGRQSFGMTCCQFFFFFLQSIRRVHQRACNFCVYYTQPPYSLAYIKKVKMLRRLGKCMFFCEMQEENTTFYRQGRRHKRATLAKICFDLLK